jgi:2-dehydropantoate 2-reductase
MAQIAIVGVGAIGGVLAGLLQTASTHALTLCTRRPLPALTIETPHGPVRVEARNLTDPLEGEAVDWILIATKTYDCAAAARWLLTLTGAHTRLAIVQNGVEHREHFAGLFPEDRMLPVIIDVPAERRPDGSVLQRANAVMRVENSDNGAAFAALFAGTTAQVEVTDDFRSAAWRKLCINAAGVVSALTLQPAGVLRDEALGQIALGLIAECVAVGRAEGAQFDDATGERILAGYRAGSPNSINSLLADRLANRPTEIDARNGVIVRLGHTHGIPTPLNAMAVALIKIPALSPRPAS